MCAKQYIGVVLDEEGVLHVTGGMILGEVQGGEDVPIVLDLRSLSDAESSPAKYIANFFVDT